MDDLGDPGFKKPNKIPVFIGEGHYQVIQFINRHIEAKSIPKEGNLVVKFDALPDDVVPKEMLTKSALEPTSGVKIPLYRDIGMHDWIKKCAQNGSVNHVIWVKPPWSEVAVEGSGVKKLDKSDGKHTEVTVDITTLGKEQFKNEPDDYEEFVKLITKYANANSPWILDIDLSFFSTINPFISLYKKADIYTLLEEIFAYKKPDNNTPEEVEEAIEYRRQQINELEEIFTFLEEHRKLPLRSEKHTERYKKVKELTERICKHYEDEHIDWKHVFDAGCVCNKLQLPVHYTERDEVMKMQEGCFSKLLDNCPCPPTIITIARSCEYDVFVPIKDCNFIEQNLVKTLNKKLNIDEPEMPYLDQ